MIRRFLLEFTTASESEFFSLPKNIQLRIKLKMEFFLNTGDPLHFAKKLSGYQNTYRFRIGDYRVLVTPKDKKTMVILLILKIGHRREVYE